jgi:hypothetical protein
MEEPQPPDPGECCGSGCSPCVWDLYYDKLEKYENWKADQEKIKEKEAKEEVKESDLADTKSQESNTMPQSDTTEEQGNSNTTEERIDGQNEIVESATTKMPTLPDYQFKITEDTTTNTTNSNLKILALPDNQFKVTEEHTKEAARAKKDADTKYVVNRVPKCLKFRKSKFFVLKVSL